MINNFSQWLTESLVGEKWPFGMAIYKEVESNPTPGTKKIRWISMDGSPVESEISVETTSDPEVFEILAGLGGYAHNYFVVILGHGIYSKHESANSRSANPKVYRQQMQDLPERFRKYLNPYVPDCPREIVNKIHKEIKKLEDFIGNWREMSDDDIALFVDHPEYAIKYLRSGMDLEKWKEKARGTIVGKKFGI